jgi:hypothetical protein
MREGGIGPLLLVELAGQLGVGCQRSGSFVHVLLRNVTGVWSTGFQPVFQVMLFA